MKTPKCTWKNCKNVAKHKRKGSLINLCDKHHKQLEDEIKGLFQQ